jgi:hypothetical protein
VTLLPAWHAVALFAASWALAGADEDKDLDFIPRAVSKAQQSAPAPQPAVSEEPSTVRGNAHVEDTFTAATAPQTLLVPFPGAAPYRWQNRTSVDLAYGWAALPGVSFALSDRLNAFLQSDFDFPSSRTFRNDLRELYATWEAAPRIYLDAGRINLRSGVALGFNPTDFFKTGSLVGQASLDPSALRENRLGTLMARAQFLWNGGSSTLAFAPKVTSPPALSSSGPALDPRFAATNSAHRLLCALSFEVAGLSPQLLAYFEQGRSRLGANASRTLGDSTILYAEWAGGALPNVTTRALDYGRRTGTLPTQAPIAIEATTRRWRNDVAAGASWTSAWRLTLNLEYHFHEGGFSTPAWESWFALGSAPDATGSFVAPVLWYLRGYANAQQEPISRHQLFGRAEWADAFIKRLNLRAFAIMSLLDASLFGQASALYSWDDAWTLGAYISFSTGASRSEHGSVPQLATGTLQIVRYL